MSGEAAARRRPPATLASATRASWPAGVVAGLIMGLVSVVATAQDAAAPADGTPPGVVLPDVIVTAERRPVSEDASSLAVTVTTGEHLERNGAVNLRQAARYVPNLNVVEFTARAITNPKARGIGGSPTNPAVTTVLDGVPLLNGDLTQLELFDLAQMEFVRGPVGALYGRNTPGGVINVLSRQPLSGPRSRLNVRAGEDGRLRVTASQTGQALPGVAWSVAGGTHRREGFILNEVSGADLNSRDADFARAQLMLMPDAAWSARLIVGGERARDGDFGLYDLAALRQAPLRVRHDFTGFTHRDVRTHTLHWAYHADDWSLTSVTGFVPYRAHEQTDLDVSDADRLIRDNQRRGEQFTQEWVLNLDPARPADHAGWWASWQLGVFAFRQRLHQDALNIIKPAFVLEFAGVVLPDGTGLDDLPGEIRQALGGARYRNLVALEDRGIGVFGQAHLERGDWQATLGLRLDREYKAGDLSRLFYYVDQSENTLYDLDLATLGTARTFDDVSPRVAVTYGGLADTTLFASWARGYRAGGFNVTPAEGAQTYEEDYSTQTEIGLRTRLADGRLRLRTSAFHIRLEDMQFNLPAPRTAYGNLGDFYIDNVGRGEVVGLDVELQAQIGSALTVFGAGSLLDARFSPGSRSGDNAIGGNRVPLSAPASAVAGARWQRGQRQGWFIQPEAQWTAGHAYDEANRAEQDAHTQWHLRAGWAGTNLDVAVWAENITDRQTIPLAIPFDGVAPSGFAGENAAPRRAGVDLHWRFQ